MNDSASPPLTIRIIGSDGSETGKTLPLPTGLLDCKVNKYLLKRVVGDHEINRAQGNRSTLLRSEVRGGGRKPWRQKGTGRARHGSIRSPIWRGGGVAFAPQAFNRSQNLSRRERRAAFAQAFALQARNAGVFGADPLDLGDGRTRTRATWLAATGLSGRVVLVDSEPNASLLRSAANIPNLSVVRADTISTYEVLFARTLVFSPAALSALIENRI